MKSKQANQTKYQDQNAYSQSNQTRYCKPKILKLRGKKKKKKKDSSTKLTEIQSPGKLTYNAPEDKTPDTLYLIGPYRYLASIHESHPKKNGSFSGPVVRHHNCQCKNHSSHLKGNKK